MDLQKLIYLEAIYRLNSFTKASEELHVTQPAITRAIKSLEHHLGVELIIREAKTFSFTDAGIALVQWAVKIMADFEEAQKEMEEYSEFAGMSLRLGISNVVGSWLYGEVISPFMRQYPQSHITIQECLWETIVQRTLNKELDLAYTTWETGFHDPDLEMRSLLTSEMYVVLPPGHKLLAFQQIPLDMLDGQRLAVFEEASLINIVVTRICQELDIHPQMFSIARSISSMLNLVSSNEALGFMVLDKKSMPIIDERKYILRPFEQPLLFNTGFIRRRDTVPNRTMKLFMQYTRNQLV